MSQSISAHSYRFLASRLVFSILNRKGAIRVEDKIRCAELAPVQGRTSFIFSVFKISAAAAKVKQDASQLISKTEPEPPQTYI